MDNSENIDDIIKILVIGNSNVGKTSLFSRYSTNEYTDIYSTTIGVDLFLKTIYYGNTNKILKLQLWDATGIERFRNIIKSYYKGTDGFIIMYDITNRKSFEDIDDWMTQLDNKNLNSRILIGNKIDLENSKREVLYNEGKELSEKYNIDFFEISVKNNINIENMFNTLLKNIKKNKISTNINKKKLKSSKLSNCFCCFFSR